MSGTRDPALYDVITPAEMGGDVEWYRTKARESGGPVLELGAGTGRITLPIAQDGLEIHALDIDAGMLEALRRKLAGVVPDVRARVTIVQGTMDDFQLDQDFALVIAPYRAFLHNLTSDQQLGCLRSVRRHLRSDGRFAFNVFHPSLEYMAQHAGPLAGVWRWTDTHQLPEGGQIVCSEASKYDTVRQVVHSQLRYEIYDAEGKLARTFLHSLELAYIYPGDIHHMLKETGFTDIQIHGGFDGRAFTRDDDELVVTCRAPR